MNELQNRVYGIYYKDKMYKHQCNEPLVMKFLNANEYHKYKNTTLNLYEEIRELTLKNYYLVTQFSHTEVLYNDLIFITEENVEFYGEYLI